MPVDYLVEFENARLKNSAGKTVFSGLTISVPPGETLFILGHNDKERTLLLYYILGLRIADSGRVRVFGRDLKELTPPGLIDMRKEIGYVHAQAGLLKHISIEENISLPLKFHTVLPETAIEQKTAEVCRFLGLDREKDLHHPALSNLLEKKILLARAVIHSPRILLLDEPTTYIEKQDVAGIKKLILDLRKHYLDPDTCVIVTSEDREWARETANCVCLLENGKIKFLGKPGNYFSKEKGE